MDRKRMRELQRSFRKRGGTFGMRPDAPKEVVLAMFEALLDCPDCRAAIIEATSSENRERSVDIDEVILDLTLRGDH